MYDTNISTSLGGRFKLKEHDSQNATVYCKVLIETLAS